MPFSPNSALYKKNYPQNINYMPAVIFFASLDFGKNCYSRTASYDLSCHCEKSEAISWELEMKDAEIIIDYTKMA